MANVPVDRTPIEEFLYREQEMLEALAKGRATTALLKAVDALKRKLDADVQHQLSQRLVARPPTNLSVFQSRSDPKVRFGTCVPSAYKKDGGCEDFEKEVFRLKGTRRAAVALDSDLVVEAVAGLDEDGDVQLYLYVEDDQRSL